MKGWTKWYRKRVPKIRRLSGEGDDPPPNVLKVVQEFANKVRQPWEKKLPHGLHRSPDGAVLTIAKADAERDSHPADRPGEIPGYR